MSSGSFPIVRVVSLLPSATEILFAIGAADDVVGVTFECDYPSEARSRRVVSTTAIRSGLTPKEIDAEVRTRIASGEELNRLDEGSLRELEPDLLVTQDLCAVCAVDVKTVDDALSHLQYDSAVLTVDPQTLEEVLGSILAIGDAVGRHVEARRLVDNLSFRLQRINSVVVGRDRPRVVVLEWTDPPFGAGHWIPDMVERAGGNEVVGESGKPSKRVDWNHVGQRVPEICVVAPCGFHLDDARHLAADLLSEGRLPAGCRVFAVDADSSFVRPGPRLVDGVEALAGIFHPDVVPPDPDLVSYVGKTSAKTKPSRSTISPTETSSG
ncbi:MAG: ABC transporter substrate-binding protein [Acidimicrobiales bacterium]